MFSGTVKLGRTPRIGSVMGRIDTSAAADGSAYASLIRANGSALGYAPTPADVGVGLMELAPAVTTGNGFAVGDEVAIYQSGTTADGVAVAIGIASFRVVANDIDDVAGYIDTEVASILADAIAIKAQTDLLQFSSGLVKVRVDAYNTGQAPLQPTVAGRTLDVSATGEAGIDLANVGSPTTTLNLSGTTIKNVTDLATTLATLDTEIDAITASIATLQSDAAAGLTAVEAGLTTIEGKVDIVQASLARALGLLHENARVDKQQYDADGNLISARVRVFVDAAALLASSAWDNGAGAPLDNTEGETQRYTVTAAYTGGRLTSYKMAVSL